MNEDRDLTVEKCHQESARALDLAFSQSPDMQAGFTEIAHGWLALAQSIATRGLMAAGGEKAEWEPGESGGPVESTSGLRSAGECGCEHCQAMAGPIASGTPVEELPYHYPASGHPGGVFCDQYPRYRHIQSGDCRNPRVVE